MLTPFYSVLVSVSVFMALSTVFHSINSPDNFPLSHRSSGLIFLPYWPFQHAYYEDEPSGTQDVDIDNSKTKCWQVSFVFFALIDLSLVSGKE